MDGEEALITPLLLPGGSVDCFPLSREHQMPSATKFPGRADRNALWRKTLAAIQSQDDRTSALHGLVHDKVAQVLGYPPDNALQNRPFVDLGMDSFTAIQLRNRISLLSGLKGLPPTLAFDASTLAAMVKGLLVRFEEITDDGGMEGTSPIKASGHVVGAGNSDWTNSARL